MATFGFDPSTTLSADEQNQGKGFGVGSKATDDRGRVWQYVQASGAITQYDFVTIDEDFQAVALAKAAVDDGHGVGVAQAAFDDNDFGWVLVYSGYDGILGRVGGSCAADVALYTSGTSGVLDDESTSQTKIDGIVVTAANTSTSAAAVEVLITFPRSSTF
jgi:hypothetical protein